LSQYERKFSHIKELEYEFRAYKEKGREMEQDTRNIILENESRRMEIQDLRKKQHDTEIRCEEMKLLALHRKAEKAERDGRSITCGDFLKGAADLKQLIGTAKGDPDVTTMTPIQKKVYNFNMAV
jgi:regulator of replication initiation timing